MVIYTDGIASRQTDKNSSETRVYKYALRSREPFPEEAIKELRRANDQRFMAAPSELIGAIQNAAQREGVPFIKVNPRYTSKTCFTCGKVNKNLKSETTWKCGYCSSMHDRDENAARNIAALGLKQLRSNQNDKKS